MKGVFRWVWEITSFKKGINEGAQELEDEAAAQAKDVTPESDKDKV